MQWTESRSVCISLNTELGVLNQIQKLVHPHEISNECINFESGKIACVKMNPGFGD